MREPYEGWSKSQTRVLGCVAVAARSSSRGSMKEFSELRSVRCRLIRDGIVSWFTELASWLSRLANETDSQNQVMFDERVEDA